MRIVLSVYIFFFLLSCCKNTEKASSENAVQHAEKPSSLRKVNEVLNGQESTHTGEWVYSNSDQIQLSLLRFKDDNSLTIKDELWNQSFLPGTNEEKVVFWSADHYQSVRSKELTPVDVSEMRGFEFAPLVIHMKRVPPWEAGTFVQHHLRVPEGEEKRTTWTEGSLRYFFMPDSYSPDHESHLPQYISTFPDYSLPANKWGATNFFVAEDLKNEALKKGYTLSGSFSTPASSRIAYDYDEWLYKSGAPPAYAVSQEKVNEWLNAVNENTLRQNFKRYVIDRHQNVKHLVLNWEALRNPYGEGVGKLQRTLKMWKQAYPDKTLSIWPHGLMELNRVNIEGNNYKYELTKDLNFKGNLDQWYGQLDKTSPFYINAFFKENSDLNYIGGYLNYPTNYGYVHHFVMQHLMNKNFQPTKPSVLMWWHHQEYVGGFELGEKWFAGADGKPLMKRIKPMVFPSAMHNAAVWAFAFCDGGELWSEPYGRTDNKNYLGASTEVINSKGRKITTAFGPVQTGQYAIQNYQNIDRWEGGKWAISMNKEIIEAETNWNFVSSARSGERFTQNDQCLPSFSLYEKTPLVAAKWSIDQKEALLLVYDAWNDPLKQEKLKVRLAGKEFEVKVFGRYTSVVRVQL
jgi:hypothetical protein